MVTLHIIAGTKHLIPFQQLATRLFQIACTPLSSSASF